MFNIIIVCFKMMNKEKMFGFLKIIFLLINLNINIILEMIFLIFSNIIINFLRQKLYW